MTLRELLVDMRVDVDELLDTQIGGLPFGKSGAPSVAIKAAIGLDDTEIEIQVRN